MHFATRWRPPMPAKKPKSKKLTFTGMAKKYGTTVSKVRKVYAKGLAAHASSGSRPGVSPHAWAAARVRSAFTGGPAAKVDRAIITGKKAVKKKK